jgi:signal transduction histidine kinase
LRNINRQGLFYLDAIYKLMSTADIRDKIPKPLLVLILAGSLLVITGAVFFYRSLKEKVISGVYNELDVITSLRAEEISKWRQEHIRDGYIVSKFLPLGKLAYSILEDNVSEKIGYELRQRMELFVADYDYHSVLIADNTGKIRFSYPKTTASEVSFSPVKGFTSGEIEFSDLHYSEDMTGMHIDMIIPIIPGDSTDMPKFGTIIFRIDPEVTLFPTIRMWATPYRTAEILLIRREGDSIVYLNSSINNSGRPDKRSIFEKKLPAVAAVEGNEGFFEGIDYRDIPVFSHLLKIPDSPWFLVAKVDRNEALRVLNRQTIMLSIIVFLFIFTFASTIFFLWRSQNSRFYKELGETKDKFVTIITHDLTNPFVSIAGFSEFLANDLKKGNYANAEKFAEIIHESSLSVVDLIRNLAQWSKIQTDQIRLNLRTVDFTSLINESIELLKSVADRKNIKIKSCTPDELIACVDREMINTVLRNLITNAIKYSRAGGDIYVSADRHNGEIKVEVIDFGIGISNDFLNKIFEAENKTSTRGTLDEPGTGLGLILCKEFVERHEGVIYAESKAGEGSKFTFTIPEARC